MQVIILRIEYGESLGINVCSQMTKYHFWSSDPSFKQEDLTEKDYRINGLWCGDTIIECCFYMGLARNAYVQDFIRLVQFRALYF